MSDLTTATAPIAPAVEARLHEVLTLAQQRSRSTSAHFERLWQSMREMAGGGKKIRPRLLTDAYAALGGTDERAAVDAACAVELLHLALVVHDDVIDRDLMRRGELNITGRFATDAIRLGAASDEARGWGEASAILAGDLLLTIAHSVLARIDVDAERRGAILDAFDDAVCESAAGEHRDVWLSLHLEQAGPGDVLAMVEQKTAAYSFQAPLVLAALLAGSATSIVDELTAIARRIGVIYQLRDDVLGLFGDEVRTGKSTLSDLREGKETLLVAYARAAPSWADVSSLLGDEKLDEDAGRRVRRVIQDSDALTLVEAIIAERCDEVHRLISESTLPPALQQQLTALTHACSSRDS
jgi:geranylgeranyl diphosphate synthase type II